MSGILTGKRGLIMGVANERSIAWGIAKAMSEAGAELAFTYQGEAFGKRLAPLAESVGSDFMVDVDVTDDASLDTAFEQLGSRWDSIDFIVHAIAYSDKSELTGRILDLGLFPDRSGAPGASLHERQWWHRPDADLRWLEPGNAKLQCHGRGQGRSGKRHALSGQ
jgi:NAD(P)-dependent dehydrogenase (short-subunit alcohol dehydrogenase family)